MRIRQRTKGSLVAVSIIATLELPVPPPAILGPERSPRPFLETPPAVTAARPSAKPAISTPPARLAGGPAQVGRLRLDQSDFNDPDYIERMRLIIGLNWYKPTQSATTNPVVHFQIERSGTIVDARIVASSGLRSVDRAALRAVIVSSPLPPLPARYPGPHLGIQVVFE